MVAPDQAEARIQEIIHVSHAWQGPKHLGRLSQAVRGSWTGSKAARAQAGAHRVSASQVAALAAVPQHRPQNLKYFKKSNQFSSSS